MTFLVNVSGTHYAPSHPGEALSTQCDVGCLVEIFAGQIIFKLVSAALLRDH